MTALLNTAAMPRPICTYQYWADGSLHAQSAILLPSIRVSGVYPAIYYVTRKHLNCSSCNVFIILAVARKQGGECEAGDRVGHTQAGLGEDTEETCHLQSKGSFHVSFSFLSLEPAFIFIYLSHIMEPLSLGRTEFSGL